MLISEAIKHLNTYDDDETVCLVLWTAEDVRAQAPGVSDEAAADVLEAMEANHDANDGITWSTIDFYLSR